MDKFNAIFARFKEVAEKKKGGLDDDDLESLVSNTGTGPVDAVYKAIDQIMGVQVVLESYAMNAVNEGIEALASTRVVIVPTTGGPNDSAAMDAQTSQLKEKKFSGSGSDTDIITSSARAYVSALNKLLTWKIRRMVNGELDTDSTGIANAHPIEGEKPITVV